MRIYDFRQAVFLWLQRAGFVESGQEGAARIRAAQIAAVVRFTPLMIVINTINAGVIIWFVGHFANPGSITAWVVSLAAAVTSAGHAFYVRQTRTVRPTASVRAIRKSTLHALVLSLIWAAVPILWLSGTTIEARLMVATLITGMICAGGFALATVPTAAFVYVIVITIGSMIGVLQAFDGYVIPFGILLAGYAATVLLSVNGTSKLFIQRFHAEAKLAERGEIIELLLNEFEENTSDWLFQTDPVGTIIDHSARFGVVVDASGQSLVGKSLKELIEPEGFEELLIKLEKMAPFKDLEVRSSANGHSWWSLTAKPIFAKSGKHIGWRGVGSDIDSRKVAEHQLEQLAYFDALTGLANRTKFKERVEESIVQAERTGQPEILMAVDIDQFKMVNDTLGHEAGDELLQVTADILTNIIGISNFAARLGNDEFGIILSDKYLVTHVEDVAHQIINAFQHPIMLQGGHVSICVSIGIVRIPDDGPISDNLLRNADLALQKAKEIGGSGFAIYNHSMNEIFQDRATLARDLRQAAAIEGQLEVWYQPQIDISKGTIAGFEALMRWKHPVRGYIPPSEFIPIAESSGLISKIGQWILKEAIFQSQLWLKNTGQDIPVAVNLSVAQLWQSDIVSEITELLNESGLPPHLLCLEMTESLFADYESGRVRRAITELKAIGVTLALDDFGTGYSSLSYLNQLPFDKLKIDRAFVTNSAVGSKERNLLQVIVNLGQGLGMTVIAEGVETTEELAILRELGCPQIQGYFFGKPAPAHLALARAIERVTVWNTEAPVVIAELAKSA